MIYLDYAANTPVDKEVLDVYYDVTLKYVANPNSIHKLGVEAKELLDNSTEKIAELLNVKSQEIIYTSGSSESNNLAIFGVARRYKNRGKHIIVSALEHSSIISPVTALLEQGYEVDVLKVDHKGKVDLEQLKGLLRHDTILVSINYVDSEIGIIQPIKEIKEILKDYPNCIFHTDATQAIGKIEVDCSLVDLMTISPHKFCGLNGFGILIKKEHVILEPLILGGKSTTIYRSGTPVLNMVVATSKALELALTNLKSRYEYIKKLNEILRNNLSKYKNVYINSNENSIPHILNISIKGVKALNILEKLEQYDVYVSIKAACCPVNTISKSVYALSNDKKLASSTIRISLSHLTTAEEIEQFLRIFDICYNQLVKE